jgi:hypothetical protein
MNKMRKFHLFGVALVAVFAFCAVGATAAFAEQEWVVDGNPVAANEVVNSETEGKLVLGTLESAGGNVLNEIECEGIFDGTLESAGKDTITKLLNTAMEEISLSTKALSCTVTFDAGASTDCKKGTTASVWPENLPWSTQIELMATITLDKIFGAAGKEPAYEVLCVTNFFGIEAEDLCIGNTSTQITEDTTTTPHSVIGAFDWKSPISSEEGKCETTGSPAFLVGSGHIYAIGATDLSGRLETSFTS